MCLPNKDLQKLTDGINQIFSQTSIYWKNIYRSLYIVFTSRIIIVNLTLQFLVEKKTWSFSSKYNNLESALEEIHLVSRRNYDEINTC